MNAFFDKLRPVAHNAWRIMIGFMFFTHGGQKLFAWFGAEAPRELFTRFGAAGVIEFTAGALIMLGLFTRPAAFIASGEMAIAYFWIHAGGAGSIWHWTNRGEMVALYSFTFLFMAAVGGGSFSLDARLFGRSPEVAGNP